MIRSPAVAGQFYVSDPTALTSNLQELVPTVPEAEKIAALAIISPHAGYMYSGKVAGETFAKVIIPQDVLILGPNHHAKGSPLALMAKGEWDMPLGRVPINEELGALLLEESKQIEEDDQAHRLEHSLEVQVPFLQFLRPDVTISPLMVARGTYDVCKTLGTAIARAIKRYGKPVLIVASSDMTHYEPRQSATTKDRLALTKIDALDPEGLYKIVVNNRISMCGIMPTTVALVAALALGATEAELIRYTDSGEASGDTRQVVGYAGVVVY